MLVKKKNSRTINSINNIGTYIIYEIIGYILTFVMRTVFIYTLGETYLGISGLFSSILKVLSLAELGFGTSIMFRLYEPLKKNDEERVATIMNFFKTVYIIVAFIILAIGVLLLPFLKYLVNDFSKFDEIKVNAYVVFLLYLLQTVSSYLFSAYKQILLTSDQKTYVLNILNCIILPLNNAILIAVLLITRNFMIYISTMIALGIADNLIKSYIIGKQYLYLKDYKKSKLSKEEKKELFKDCFSLFLRQTSTTILNTSDTFIISAFLGLSAVGLHSNYYMVYTMLDKIPRSLLSNIQASLGNKFIDMDLKEKEQYSLNLNFSLVLLYGVAAVAIASMLNELITVWIGEKYVIDGLFVLFLALQFFIAGLKQHLSVMRKTLGLFNQYKFSAFVSVLVNVVVSILLIRYGMTGVLIGTIVSEVFINMIFEPLAVYKYGLKNTKGLIKYYLKNALYLIEFVVIGIICYLVCSNFLVGYGWLSAIVHSILCGIIALALFVLFNLFTKEFANLKEIGIRTIKNIFKKRKKI